MEEAARLVEEKNGTKLEVFSRANTILDQLKGSIKGFNREIDEDLTLKIGKHKN